MTGTWLRPSCRQRERRLNPSSSSYSPSSVATTRSGIGESSCPLVVEGFRGPRNPWSRVWMVEVATHSSRGWSAVSGSGSSDDRGLWVRSDELIAHLPSS